MSDKEDFSGGENDRIGKRIPSMDIAQIETLQDQLDSVIQSPLEPSHMTKDRASKLYKRTWKRIKELTNSPSSES